MLGVHGLFGIAIMLGMLEMQDWLERVDCMKVMNEMPRERGML